ncbi:MAG: cell division protein FtsL [Treponema sp.]|nr:cell division protein FtsL [Treponema sp.]
MIGKSIIVGIGFAVGTAFAVPFSFLVQASVARTTMEIEEDIGELEKKQELLVKENERLITDISLLKSSSRIKDIAEGELGMHPAESGDIVRVKMKDADK